MENVAGKIKRGKALEIVKKILTSKFLPFVTAGVLLICYYLGWDIVAAYYIGIVSTLILLLLDDVTPAISQFLFINLIVSLKNVPGGPAGDMSYYSQVAIQVQMVLLGVALIGALIYRFVLCCIKKKFKLTPVFFGLCGLTLAFLLNGLFSEYYTVNNLMYGAIMAVLFFGLFVVLKDSIKVDKDFFEKIAYGFIALSALLVVELVVAYATYENLVVDGVIDRSKLFFGWGVYNTYGLLITMCLPAATYLAGRTKHGYVFTLYSLVIFTAAMLSCSRQAMIVAAVVFPVCLVLLFIKGMYKIQNICITAGAAVIGIILIIIFREDFVKSIQAIFDNVIVDGELNGSGRIKIWEKAIKYFTQYPVLGAGFYLDYGYGNNAILYPDMCHNTILEFLGSCGIVGFAAYLLHRVQTIISFIKKPTVDRAFIGLSIIVLLLMSLLDIHLFSIFPTIIYSCLIAAFIKSEEKDEEEIIYLPLSKRNMFYQLSGRAL